MPTLTEQERLFLDRVFGPGGTLRARQKTFKRAYLVDRVRKIREAAGKLGMVEGESQVAKLITPYLIRAQELSRTDEEGAFHYLKSIEASVSDLKKSGHDIGPRARAIRAATRQAIDRLNQLTERIQPLLTEIRAEVQAVVAGYVPPSSLVVRARYGPPITQASLAQAHAFSMAECTRLNTILETARTRQALIARVGPHIQAAQDVMTTLQRTLAQIDEEVHGVDNKTVKALYRTMRLVAEQEIRGSVRNDLLTPSGKSIKSSRELLGDTQVQLDTFISVVIRDLAALEAADAVALRQDRIAPDADLAELQASQATHRQQVTALADKTRELGRLMRSQATPHVGVEPAATLSMTELVFEGGVLSPLANRAATEAAMRMQTKLLRASPQEREDLCFDFLVTSNEARIRKLCDAAGFDPDALSPAQTLWVNSVLNGVSAVLADAQTGRLLENGERLLHHDQVLEKQATLGTGAFGQVSLFAPSGGVGPALAVKSLNPASIQADDPAETERLRREARDDIEIELRTHKHLMRGAPDAIGRQYIVSLEAVVEDAEGNLNMVMEVADGGDLNKNMEGMTYASEAGVLTRETQDILNARQMKQLLEGMIYLRNMGVTHFDMKPANVFMTANGTLKIGDFGSGRVSLREGGGQIRRPGASTSGYAAPTWEQLDDPAALQADVDGGDSSFDTHALGRIMDMMGHNKNLVQADGQSRAEGVLDELLKAMTHPVSTLRPSLEQVLDSPYFAKATAVPEEDLAELQRLSALYGQAVARYLKENEALILTSLGFSVPEYVRAERARGEKTLTQVIEQCITLWDELNQAIARAQTAVQELEEPVGEDAPVGDERPLPPDIQAALTNPVALVGDSVPQRVGELNTLTMRATAFLELLRARRLEIATASAPADIREQLRVVQERIAEIVG